MADNALKLGIAGLGTVGTGVVKILQSKAALIEQRCGRPVEIVAVSARSKKDRGINLDGISWYDNAVDIASDKSVDVVVELIGGSTGPAYDLCEKALKNGKHFITANKALIARHGSQIAALAEKHRVHVAFEAAVAGGIPVIKTLKEALSGNRISRVSGILNGTCNYILTAMKETGRSFEEILKEAQDLGYAEADPSFDVDGVDAAHKLAILTSLAFGTKVDFNSVHTEGIRNITLQDIRYADELGYKIKLLGICAAEDKGVSQRVTPCLVQKTYPVASVDGVNNAVYIEGDAVGKLVLSGPGAGQGATASAVVGDIVDMAAGRYSPMFGVPSNHLSSAPMVDIKNHYGEYYLRITARDEPGVLAAITGIFKKTDISLESVLQKPSPKGQDAHIVVVTHDSFEKTINKAVEKIEKIGSVVARPVVIRIES